MRLLQYLQEEFFKYCKNPYSKKLESLPIYKNPTSSDMGEMKKEFVNKNQPIVRVIIDLDKRNVYIFDAIIIAHQGVIDQLGNELSKNIVTIISSITKDNKLSRTAGYGWLSRLPEWADKYFKGKDKRGTEEHEKSLQYKLE
jgi:hypothetical protein